MRKLIILRGAPGCGKSHFIKEHNLGKYTLSSDDIRLMYNAPVQNLNGDLEISQTNNNAVWNLLFSILESRMKNGEFTIVDATHSITKQINKYKVLCDKYKYRLVCVDFTDVSESLCIERNHHREGFRVVPNSVIHKMYERFRDENIPSGIKVIKPNEIENELAFNPIDLSHFNKIHILGDIHGCYDTLMQRLSNGLKSNEYYIFCGDYIDRGTKSNDVLKYLYKIKDRENVLLLEGNHDHYFNDWANDEHTPDEFTNNTRLQLESDTDFTKREARQLYRSLCQCAYFTFYGKRFFVSHGGINKLPENLTFMSANQMIRGVGKYSEYDIVADYWHNNQKDCVLVNGHRNLNLFSTDVFGDNTCFNLEGQIEFGGSLRSVVINRNGIKIVNTPCVDKLCEHLNNERNIVNDVKISDDMPIETVVKIMRKNPFIREKKFGNISSFNFTRNAFNTGVWNSQTMRARGLYIDTVKNKIVARGYDKFFNINENEVMNYENLKSTLKFPATAYRKENGYLGLISCYDDELFFATKSDINGDYNIKFKELFEKWVIPSDREYLKSFLHNNNCTLVVEVIYPEFDSHIINYKSNRIYALDLIKNQLKYEHLSYEQIYQLASKIDIFTKSDFCNFKSVSALDDFLVWVDTMYCEQCDYVDAVEGFVIEDSSGFMFKYKTPYYKKWKKLRSIIRNKSFLDETLLKNNTDIPYRDFLEWTYSNQQLLIKYDFDIIKLREEFMKVSE